MLLLFYWTNTKLVVLLMNWHIKLFRTNTRLTTTQNNYHFDIFLRSVIFLSGIKESHTGLLCFVYHQRCLLFHLCDKKSFQSPPLSFDLDQLNPESGQLVLKKQINLFQKACPNKIPNSDQLSSKSWPKFSAKQSIESGSTVCRINFLNIWAHFFPA